MMSYKSYPLFLLFPLVTLALADSPSQSGFRASEVRAHPDAAARWHELGKAAWSRRDLDTAEGYFRKALALRERQELDDLPTAQTLNQLGLVTASRGDLALADEQLKRAADILEARSPRGLAMAENLSARGLVAFNRGDVDRVEEYERQALAIREELTPDGLEEAASLNALGNVALARGDFDLAESRYRRALVIREKLEPASIETANTSGNLGIVAVRRGDLVLAESWFQRALALCERLAPESLKVANGLQNLGNVALGRGDLAAAEDRYERALALREKLAPGTTAEVALLQSLGKVARERRRPRLAAEYLDRAVATLERQIDRLGGSRDAQGSYRAAYGRDVYRDAVEVLVEDGEAGEAFHVLERSRARSLLAMLAERDAILRTDVPDDLSAAHHDLVARHDRVLEEMAGLSLNDKRVEGLHRELGRLGRLREDLELEIRNAAPGLADLRYPRPLTLAQTLEILDPGTTMLSYSVGKERTYVFAVTAGAGLRVAVLPVGEVDLRSGVAEFRRAIARTTSRQSCAFSHLQDAGRELYRLLVEPVDEVLAGSDRLVIVPDGPLHVLPFGALVRDDSTGTAQYLSEWKPLHYVLSATLYEQLERSRPASGAGSAPSLAIFGDPRYPGKLRGEETADGLFEWSALPYSRRESEGIAELYPPGRVRLYLGAEATEERVKALPESTSIVHFAVHSHVDDELPMSSALAFTMPGGRDNGLLQAWEIFASVRLHADLVVLSACASALGEERGGEGLIGLTRAFQYAGARSVAATLWNVDDEATAELMVRFHRHLLAGKSKDEALRAAQVELIRGSDASAPYYWAAFQLFGDWR